MALALFTFSMSAGVAFGESQNEQGSDVTLRAAIQAIGEVHGRHFTLEEGYYDGDASRTVEVTLVRRPDEKAGLDEALSRLSEDVPWLSYVIDNEDKGVIHLVDRRLIGQQGYAIEETVERVSYDGALPGFLTSLGSKGISVTCRSFSTNEPVDLATVIHAEGEKLLVRDALSRFVPLNGRRGHILWIATTRIGKNQPTEVHYYGAVVKPLAEIVKHP